MFNNNDDRFLVLLQTKDTPHIEPIYPVSYASL
jgi:hypothetical protein